MNFFPHPRAGKQPVLLARGWFLLALLAGWLISVMPAGALTLTENFAGNPLTNGWKIYGVTNLFQWSSANQNLAVTWDNSKTNSYFYKPLGTILAKSDAFSVAFDLRLTSIASDSPQIAIGLFNYSKATNSSFSRPAATTPDLFEFTYYADNGLGDPSITATLTDTNVGPGNTKDFYFVYDNLPFDVGTTYHVVMTHAVGAANLTGQVLVNGQTYTSLPLVYYAPITDFRIDTLSISSYGGGTVRTPAQGVVDNFTVTLPPPPIQNQTNIFNGQSWRTTFNGQTNWLYALQRTTNFLSWSNVVVTNFSSGTVVTLTDTNPPTSHSFYRVQATRP